MAGDTMPMFEEMFFPVPRQPISTEDITSTTSLMYIPPELHPAIFKTFYKGYSEVFKGISRALARPSIPTPSVVLFESSVNGGGMGYFDSQALHFYLNKGGRVEFALDCITHAAKEQSPLGDGSFEDLWDDEDSGSDLGWKEMPTCRNDLEFELVRARLGLDPRRMWGPYRSSFEIGMFGGGSDDDMLGESDDEDEDEDDDEL
jgi:hypothetical protein